MKRFFIMAAVCLVIGACQKNRLSEAKDSDYLKIVKTELGKLMFPGDFKNLDFSDALISGGDEDRLFICQVPFIEKKANEFVLLKTDKEGHIEVGKIIDISGAGAIGGNINKREATARESLPLFDGAITIQSLNRKVELSSSVNGGYIESLHKGDSTGRLYSSSGQDIILVTSYNENVGISWSTWFRVMQMLDLGYGGGIGGWYSPVSSGGGGGSTGGSGEGMIYIRPETEVNNPAINLFDYVNCFSAIPDAGATCTITIFTDLPVNGDPTKFFDFSSGSPGHTWLRFEKSNGGQSVSQNIGFYPASDWKTTTTTAPLKAKFVDNGHHEYNAAYQLSITPAQLQSGLTYMLYLRSMQYDIDDFNCTDWAIKIFNDIVRPEDALTIPKFDLPFGVALHGTSTPQGVFIRLRQLLSAGTAGVDIPLVGWAGLSKGPCAIMIE